MDRATRFWMASPPVRNREHQLTPIDLGPNADSPRENRIRYGVVGADDKCPSILHCLLWTPRGGVIGTRAETAEQRGEESVPEYGESVFIYGRECLMSDGMISIDSGRINVCNCI